MTLDKFLENKDELLSVLFDLLRIPSISADPKHKPDMERMAELWKQKLLGIGMDEATVYVTDGNPVTFAKKIIDPKLPTVMIYAHMDVMPVDPLELWHTDPFEPLVKDGRIWARGADDDKGQSYIHFKAVEYLLKNNLLNCNVKFIIEGEEEVGSQSLPAFIDAHKDLLNADIILVSDTSMINPTTPAITSGLRGLAYWQIEVTGPSRDLHSGLFGGAVANPANILCELIADMFDENRQITIPGFYDDVLEVSDYERELINKTPIVEEEYKKSLNVKALLGEKGYSIPERTGIRPTFDVCGIWAGFTGEGAKTVIPSKAYAKVSSRIVPDQDPDKIADMLVDHLNKIAPDYVTVKVEKMHGGRPYVCPIDIPAYKAAEKACEAVFGKTPVSLKSGGSIPIISTFEEKLGLKSVLLGFGLESDAIHSPNENFPVENIVNGIKTSVKFFEYFSEMA
ncbi:dipeptidase [Saccharicrinis sp. FJH62]|uniref:dipeptidase n=1 Tax=Saccharicrinis sp. FJH62 TaxID=3344657 RepID=UPI0035D4B29D